MIIGTYIGPVKKLQGKTAMVMFRPNTKLIHVQFDDPELGELAHGWHQYLRADWEIQEKKDEL